MRNLSKNLQEKMERAWLCGFVDGEGCFSIRVQRYGPDKRNVCLRPDFAITQHKKDKFVLDKVQRIIGIGNVVKRGVDGHFVYQIHSIKDAQILIDFFDFNDFLSIKKNDYELWKKCVIMLKDGHHRTYDGLIEILKLRQEINKDTKSKKRISLNDIKQIVGKNYSKRVYLDNKKEKKMAKFRLRAYKGKKLVNFNKYGLSDRFETKTSLDRCLRLYKLSYPNLNFKIERMK